MMVHPSRVGMGLSFIFCPGVEGFSMDVVLKKIITQKKNSISNNHGNREISN
jgi:hypothetical protein